MSSRGGRVHEDYGQSSEENQKRLSGSWERRDNRSTRMTKAKFKYCTTLNVREGQPRDRHVGLYSPDCTVTYNTPLGRSPPHDASEMDFESGRLDSLTNQFMKEKIPDRDAPQRPSNRIIDGRSRSPIFPNEEDREVFEINHGQSSRYQDDDSYHGELFRPLEWEEIGHSPSPTPRQQYRGSSSNRLEKIDNPQGDCWEDRRDRRNRRENPDINRSNKRDVMERDNRGRRNWHEKQDYCQEDWSEGKDGSGGKWVERLEPSEGDHSNNTWPTRRASKSSKDNWREMTDRNIPKDDRYKRRDDTNYYSNKRKDFDDAHCDRNKRKAVDNTKYERNRSNDSNNSKHGWTERQESSKDNWLDMRDHSISQNPSLDRLDRDRSKDNWQDKRGWESSKDDWTDRRSHEFSKNDWPVKRDLESLKDNWFGSRETGSPVEEWCERRKLSRNIRPETSDSRKDEWLARHDNVKEAFSGRKEETSNDLDRYERRDNLRDDLVRDNSPSRTAWPGRSDKHIEDFPLRTRPSHLFDPERELYNEKTQAKEPPPAEVYDYNKLPLLPPPPPPPILSLSPPLLSHTTDYSKPLPFKPSVMYDVECVKQSMQLLEKLKKKQEILSKCELKIGELYRSRTKLCNEPSSFFPSVQRLIQSNCNESPVLFIHQALTFNCIKNKSELEDPQLKASTQGNDCTDSYESMGLTDRNVNFSILKDSMEDYKSADNILDQFGSADYPFSTDKGRSPSHFSSVDMLNQKPSPPCRPLSPDYHNSLPLANPIVDMAYRTLQEPSSQMIKEPQPEQPNVDSMHSHQPHSRGSGWPIYKAPAEVTPHTSSSSVRIPPPPPVINTMSIEPALIQTKDNFRPNRSLITLNLLPRDNDFKISSCGVPYNNPSHYDIDYSSPQADSAYAYKVEEFLAKIQGESKKPEKYPISVQDRVVLSDDDDVIYVGESKNSPSRNKRRSLSSSRRSEKNDYGNRKESISRQSSRYERERQFPDLHSSGRRTEKNDYGNRKEIISDKPFGHEMKSQFLELPSSSGRSEKNDGNRAISLHEQPSRQDRKSQSPDLDSYSWRSEKSYNYTGNRKESISKKPSSYEMKSQFQELPSSSGKCEKIGDGNKAPSLYEPPSRQERKSQSPGLPLPYWRSEENDDRNKTENISEQSIRHERKRQFTELSDEPPGTSPLPLPTPFVTSPKKKNKKKNTGPDKGPQIPQILPKLTAAQSSNLTLIVGKNKDKPFSLNPTKPNLIVVGSTSFNSAHVSNKNPDSNSHIGNRNSSIPNLNKTYRNSNISIISNQSTFDRTNMGNKKNEVNNSLISSSSQGKQKESNKSATPKISSSEINTKVTTANAHISDFPADDSSNSKVGSESSKEKSPPKCDISNVAAVRGSSEEMKHPGCASPKVASAPRTSKMKIPPSRASSTLEAARGSSKEKKTKEEKEPSCKQGGGTATAKEAKQKNWNDGSKLSDFENIFRKENEIAITIHNIQTNDERLKKVFTNTLRNKTINKSLCIKNGMLCLNNEMLGVRIVASTIEEKIIYYLHCLFHHRNDHLTTILQKYFTPIKELGERIKSALKSCEHCLKRSSTSNKDDRQCSKDLISKNNTNSVKERSVDPSQLPVTDVQDSSVSKDASDETVKDPMSIVKEIQSSSKQINDIISKLDRDEIKTLYFQKNNLLLKRCHVGGKTLLKILLPEDKIEEIIILAHQVFSSHGNTKIVLSILEKQFSPLPGLESHIEKIIAGCSLCSDNKTN